MRLWAWCGVKCGNFIGVDMTGHSDLVSCSQICEMPGKCQMSRCLPVIMALHNYNQHLAVYSACKCMAHPKSKKQQTAKALPRIFQVGSRKEFKSNEPLLHVCSCSFEVTMSIRICLLSFSDAPFHLAHPLLTREGREVNGKWETFFLQG